MPSIINVKKYLRYEPRSTYLGATRWQQSGGGSKEGTEWWEMVKWAVKSSGWVVGDETERENWVLLENFFEIMSTS